MIVNGKTTDDTYKTKIKCKERALEKIVGYEC